MASVLKEIEISAGTSIVKWAVLAAVVIGAGYYVVGKVSGAVGGAVDAASKKITAGLDAAGNAVSPEQRGADVSDWVSGFFPSDAEKKVNDMLRPK